MDEISRAFFDLPVADKPDSQEICFIPDHDYRGFVEKQRPDTPRAGQFVDERGTVVGAHEGVHRFTIGQRRGLGIAAGEPVYVTGIDKDANRVQVGSEQDLYRRGLTGRGLNLMKREHIRRTPVVKDGKLVGIVSDKDLLNASPSPATSLSVWELNYLLSKITVSEVMTKNVLTVTEDTPIEEAARIMADNKIGGLPVIRGGHVVGRFGLHPHCAQPDP